MKRIFDFLLATIIFFLFFWVMIFIAIAIKISSKGPILYWSDRVGKNNLIFRMPKFRSMKVDTPEIATHLFKDPSKYLTPIGRFLRLTSLDEFPQLFSVIRGHMSIVGPRPALFNQNDLIALRIKYGIDHLMPGITGWAQINGRDGLSIREKVEFDLEYLNCQSLLFDLKIILLTFNKVLKLENHSH